MKKLLILLLALVMCLTALTSCEKVLGIFFNPVEPQPEVEYNVNSAAAFIEQMYGGEANVIQSADYKVTTKSRYSGVAYDVTWTVDNDKIKIETIEGDANNVLINVPEKSSEEITYKLTATVTAPNGDKATVSFDRKVPVYNVLSWDVYMAAAKGDHVTVEGIVVAINAKSLGNSRNHLFLADASGKGGYYSYQMDEDPVKAGVKVGMTVSVSGPVEPYSGMQEIKGGTFAIVDETIQTVNPVDITDYILAGNTDFSQYVALTVTIKGVTLGSQDLEKDTSQYLYFELNGLKSYVRTYVTDFPTTLDAKTATAENPDKAAIDKAHADHFGYKADVTGILILYNGNPYLIPMSVDCFTNFEEVTYTDEDKVDSEIEGIVLPESITSDTTLELPLVGKNYTDVTIAWAIDNVNYTIGEDGKLPITLGSSAVTVKLTATLTCGTTTKTQEYTVVISANLVMHENHPYGTYINQVNAGKVLFLDGGVDGRYLTTTTDPSKAVAVYAEKAEGGYKLYILVEDVKNYINVYNNDEGKSSVNYSASAGSVFTYDKIVNAWVTTLGTDTVYLGTYKTFETVSVSYTSYINSENTGVSQFPLEILATTPGAALNMFVNQVNADKVLYLDGGVDGRYLTTTTDLSKAVAVYAEKVEGGLKFYILVDGVKNYINVYNNSEGKSSVNYSAEAGSVFTYDPIVNALVTTLGTDTVYLGTYKTFETISVSYTSYIDASNTGVSQFPLDITAATVVAEEKHECENVCQFCGKCTNAECTDPVCAEKCQGVHPVTVTVYYKNVDNWAQVSAWVWTDSENFTGGNWPGKAATAVEGADGWYSYSFTTTSSLDGLKLIFNNNGNGSQTANLTYDPEKLYWCNGTAYATMDAANAAQLVKVWYLRGDMTGDTWPALPEYQLQRAEDGTASVVLELAAGGKFKIATADWKNEFNSASKGVVDGVNFADAGGGNIKVLTAGTYKFVVSADDSTLTITPVVKASEESFKIVANGGTLSADSKSLSWASDNFNYVAEKGTNNNNPRTSDTDHFRIYQGNNFTITGKDGEKMTKVVFTATSASYATVLATSLTNSGYTATANGSTVTVEIADGVTTLTFTTTAQTRINNIVITYTK